MRNGLGRALERGVRFGSLITVSLAVSSGGSAGDLCPADAVCTIETDAPPYAGAVPATTAIEPAAGGARTPAAGAQLPLPLAEVAWSALMDRHDLIIGAIDAHHDDAYEYRLPYGEQVSYPVIQGYGAHLSHRGVEQYTVDFGMPVGTPVYAAREGVVALAEDSHDFGCPVEACGRLANFVVVLHSDGTTGEYFHLQRGSVQVRLGERVARGALLAFSGNTGYTTAPHLHFGVYRTERDGRTQSLAVSFATREGSIRELREGARYVNLPAAGN
jgi:murein DD-endopeptidase MepM/ murein hydrolase activator NlpD